MESFIILAGPGEFLELPSRELTFSQDLLPILQVNFTVSSSLYLAVMLES